MPRGSKLYFMLVLCFVFLMIFLGLQTSSEVKGIMTSSTEKNFLFFCSNKRIDDSE